MRQRSTFHDFLDGRALAPFPFLKLEACRHVEEQIRNPDAGADRTGHGFGRNRPGLRYHADPDIRIASPGHEIEARYRGDRGQGFAPETERADGQKIRNRRDLAGRVSLQGQDRIAGLHAVPIVNDADEGEARAFDLDGDVIGPGVDGIFEQFLDHGCGPFDHLAGRDLVHERVGQHLDALRFHRGRD